jgi:FkbM family methyltransferase
MIESLRRKFTEYRDAAGTGSTTKTAISVVLSRLGIEMVAPAKLPDGGSIFLRRFTSDEEVMRQVFARKDYDFTFVRAPSLIIDAGANIGCTSVYFSQRFPDATVIAVEPEPGNVAILQRNAVAYPNIKPVHAALWNTGGTLQLFNPDRGNWGFTVKQSAAPEEQQNLGHVRAVTVPELLSASGHQRIDVLKMDIEGAEFEVLQSSESWIDRVDCLVVELHERFRPGCTQLFDAIADRFDHRWEDGELQICTRAGAAVIPPA